MKSNTSKTETMIVSRSRKMHPQSPPLTIGGPVMRESDDIDKLAVIFDSKMTFAPFPREAFKGLASSLKLLDCVVTGANFFTVGLFECDIAHR